MFELNPLNLSDATWQHGLMLLVAAGLGFLIGYTGHRRLIVQLTDDLDRAKREPDNVNRRQSEPVTNEDDDEETVVLKRVSARSDRLDFDRIGRATPADADDLEAIVGIGPFLAKKLNAIGIYTFRQLANLTPEDVYQVNEIIEFFPGRIERDNWVGQATERVK